MIREAIEQGFAKPNHITIQFICTRLHASTFLTCSILQSMVLGVFDLSIARQLVEVAIHVASLTRKPTRRRFPGDVFSQLMPKVH